MLLCQKSIFLPFSSKFIRCKSSIRSQIKRVADELSGVESVFNKQHEAALLVGHLINKPYDYVLMNPNDNIPQEKLLLLDKMVELRKKEVPMAYILQKKEFWSIDFFVNEHTLIPRPDTEVLVSFALKYLSQMEGGTILDLGTGSGCILISLLKELDPMKWKGVGVDINPKAIEVAQINSKSVGLSPNCIEFKVSNWGDEIKNQKFNLVTSNPPYIDTLTIKSLSKTVREYEPLIALDGGEKGLEKYIEISKQIDELLENNGIFIAEIGINQAQDVIDIFTEYSKLQHIETHKDIKGIERCIVWKKNGVS